MPETKSCCSGASLQVHIITRCFLFRVCARLLFVQPPRGVAWTCWLRWPSSVWLADLKHLFISKKKRESVYYSTGVSVNKLEFHLSFWLVSLTRRTAYRHACKRKRCNDREINMPVRAGERGRVSWLITALGKKTREHTHTHLTIRLEGDCWPNRGLSNRSCPT